MAVLLHLENPNGSKLIKDKDRKFNSFDAMRRVLSIDQIKEVQQVQDKDWSGHKALDYTLLMTLELKNFLGVV